MAGNPKDSCSRDSKPAKQLPAEWWSGRPSCRMTEDWSDRPANSHSLLAVTQVIRNRPWEFQKLGFADSHCPFLLPSTPRQCPPRSGGELRKESLLPPPSSLRQRDALRPLDDPAFRPWSSAYLRGQATMITGLVLCREGVPPSLVTPLSGSTGAS